MYSIGTPIVLIIFNRPGHTLRVLERLAIARPRKLYVVADGPRKDVPEEENECLRTRDLIDKIDWDCQISNNYADSNLGCRKRVSSGLDWVFSEVDSAIILEDDCLPDLSFFGFCNELLEHYATDERVMAISGDNFQFGRQRTYDSYYFSRYFHCWGWATWRRAWQYYDAEMALWPEIRDRQRLRDILCDYLTVRYWQNRFQQTYEGHIDTWDYVWTLSCWQQHGLCILPSASLVSNIGFGVGGTHHATAYSPFANMPTESIAFPLTHPKVVIQNSRADRFTQFHQFGLFFRLYRKLRSSLKI